MALGWERKVGERSGKGERGRRRGEMWAREGNGKWPVNSRGRLGQGTGVGAEFWGGAGWEGAPLRAQRPVAISLLFQ